jgi:hypothetical protein
MQGFCKGLEGVHGNRGNLGNWNMMFKCLYCKWINSEVAVVAEVAVNLVYTWVRIM